MKVTEVHFSRAHDGGAHVLLLRDGKLLLQTIVTRYKSREALANLVNDAIERGDGYATVRPCGWSYYARDGTSIELPTRQKVREQKGDEYGSYPGH